MFAKKYFPLMIGALATTGVFGVLLLTRWGGGLFDWDSFNYLAAARNFAHGNGLTYPINATVLRPMVNFPPFYPILLSLFEFFRIPAIDAARWLNAVLFGVNLSLTAYIVWLYSRSKLFSLISACLFLLSADLLKAHSWILSEPLLISLILSGFLFFKHWLDTRKPIFAAVLFVTLGLAVLTKFVGAALTAAVVILFAFSDLPKRRKIAYTLGAFAAGFLPFVFWIARTFTLTSTLNGYGFGYVPLQRGNLITAFFTFFTWFLPERLLFGREQAAFVLGLVCLSAVIYYLIRHARNKDLPFQTAAVFISVFFAVYIFIVVAAKMFFDHGIGLQDRMFIPLLPLFLILITLIAASISANFQLKGRVASYVVLLALAVGFGTSAFSSLPPVYEDGLGWNSRVVNTSAAIKTVKGLAASDNVFLYSNNIFAMYFQTGSVGEDLNDFPPSGNWPNVFLVIFKSQINGQHPLTEEYENNLDLLIEDDVLSIYHYESH